jgi:uncharacterized protein involved in tellurium resistance
MIYKLSTLAVVLAIGVGLLADDKKKDTKTVKGKVVSFDRDKKVIKLKTDDKEKEYTTGDELVVNIRGGGQFKIPMKMGTAIYEENPVARRNAGILSGVLRTDNEVELVLADKDMVKEVHFNPRAASTTRKPEAKPASKSTTPPPAAKPAEKTDTKK